MSITATRKSGDASGRAQAVCGYGWEGKSRVMNGSPEAGYDESGERPLRAYTGLTIAFSALAAGGYAALRAAGKEPPPGTLGRVVRIGVATHKLSRIIGRDKVTAPYRAPFTTFQGSEDAPPAEVREKVRGEGVRRAFGELITCPYCMTPWLATGFWFAGAAAPRETDVAIDVLDAVALSDFLQLAYLALDKRAT